MLGQRPSPYKTVQSFGHGSINHGYHPNKNCSLIRWNRNSDFTWHGQDNFFVDNEPYDGALINTVLYGGGAKWNRGSYFDNGFGYMAPFSSTAILRVNTDTLSYTEIGSFSGINKCAGMIAAPNRKLYCIPYSYAGFIVLCPDENERMYVITTEANLLYSEGVVASNGLLYTAMAGGYTIGVIDTKNDSFRQILLSSTVTFNFQTCALYEDIIYYIPSHGGTPSFFNNRILMMDIHTEAFDFVGPDIPNGYTYLGTKVGVDGRIYSAPYSGTNNLLEFNPRTQEINYYDVGTSGFNGMVLSGDGDLVLIPHLNTCANVVKFNTRTKTYTTTAWTAENAGYGGGFLAENGTIFGTALNATRRFEFNSPRKNKLLDIDFVIHKQTR